MAGKVYLIGAGPGRPELATTRARDILSKADVLVFDAPCSPELLGLAPAGAERIAVGRWPDALSMSQADINQLLVERARAGRCVVRLKNGDPFVFGRGGEEALAATDAGLEIEVVPGVTAGIAAAALAGIPITQRGITSSVTLGIVQSPCPGDWDLDLELMARGNATLVLYLGPEAVPAIAAELVRAGRGPETPCALVRDVSGAGQQVRGGTLSDFAAGPSPLPAPLIFIVGEAVALRQRLCWQERRPLHGRAVAVTQPRAEARELIGRLEEQGAEVLELPCVAIEPPSSWEALDLAIGQLSGFDWIVLASAHVVEAFLSRLASRGKDARALGRARIAAIGEATAGSLAAVHLVPDLLSAQRDAEALAVQLRDGEPRGGRFLILGSSEGDALLSDALCRLGAEVTLAPACQTVCPTIDLEPLRQRAREGRLAAVAFDSALAVRSFVSAFEDPEGVELLARVSIMASDPAAARAVEKLGLQVAVQPAEATGAALVESLVALLRG